MAEDGQYWLFNLWQVVEDWFVDYVFYVFWYDVVISIKVFGMVYCDVVGNYKFGIFWYIVEILGDIGFDLVYSGQFYFGRCEYFMELLLFVFVEGFEVCWCY